MTIHDCLSDSDVHRLKDVNLVLESNVGKLLGKWKFRLNFSRELFFKEQIGWNFLEEPYTVEPNSDGSIPEDAIFPFSPLEPACKVQPIELSEVYHTWYWERYKRKKVSAGMAEYLWPSDEGDTQVEFRSPVPHFPPRGQLRVVCTNMKGYGSGKTEANFEYCLAADKDGTVKWLPESECVDGSHVWTVHLFERRGGEVLHLRDQLQRREPNVYNNCEFNYIGGNVNGSGTQTIGNVTTNQLLDFRKVYLSAGAEI